MPCGNHRPTYDLHIPCNRPYSLLSAAPHAFPGAPTPCEVRMQAYAPVPFNVVVFFLPLQVKEEGWWLLLGDPRTDQLLALKRLSFGATAHAKLQFPGYDPGFGAPGGAQDGRRLLVLHLISDSYLGLDQKFDIECGA